MVSSVFAAPAPDAPAPGNDGAEEVTDIGLTEVTVTAERRATDLQNTPIAVSSVNADALQQQGLADFRDLAGLIPNLVEPKRSTAYTTQIFSIRGIGETDTYPSPSVALYVDDQYLARSVGAMYDTPDLDRVEVLRGPQGTLYGRNSPAGAIRFLTPDPTDETRAYAEFGYGSYNEVDGRVTASGALVPGVLDASIAYVHRQREGWMHDDTLDRDVNAITLDTVRAKLLLKARGDLQFLLAVDGMLDGSDASFYSAGVGTGPAATWAGSNPNTTGAALAPYNRTRTGGVSLRISDSLNDHLSFKLVSAVHAMNGPILYDNTGVAAISNINWAGFTQSQQTQELTLNGDWDRVHFVAGLFYFHEYFNNNRIAETAASAAGTSGTLNQYNSDLTTHSYSAFGEASYRVTDALTVTAGGRYTLDQERFINTGITAGGVPLINSGDQATLLNYAYRLAAARPGAAYATDNSGAWANFSPKVSLEYQWTPHLMQYATFSMGFKSGGFDLRATSAAQSSATYDPETTSTYEVGLKGEYFDRRLRLNLAAFYNDISNVQVSIYDQTIPALRRMNGGDAYTEGVEIESSALPLPGLQWDASLAYLATGYGRFGGALPPGNLGGITTLVGRQFPLAPHIQINSGVNYTLPLPAAAGVVRVGINGQYQTAFFTDIYNSAALRMPAQSFFNATLNHTSADTHWYTALSVKNFTDRQYAQTGSVTAAYAYYGYNPPRTALLTVRYSY